MDGRHGPVDRVASSNQPGFRCSLQVAFGSNPNANASSADEGHSIFTRAPMALNGSDAEILKLDIVGLIITELFRH